MQREEHDGWKCLYICIYLLNDDGTFTPLQSNQQRKAAVVSFMYGSARTAPGISSGLRTTRAFSGVTSPLFGVLTTVTPRPFGASTSDKDRQTRGRFQY